MSEYIKKNILLEAIAALQPSAENYAGESDGSYWAARDMYDDIKTVINGATPADVIPARTGAWRRRLLSETGKYELECEYCGFRVVIEPFEMKYANYCNNCGKKNKFLIESGDSNEQSKYDTG